MYSGFCNIIIFCVQFLKFNSVSSNSFLFGILMQFAIDLGTLGKVDEKVWIKKTFFQHLHKRRPFKDTFTNNYVFLSLSSGAGQRQRHRTNSSTSTRSMEKCTVTVRDSRSECSIMRTPVAMSLRRTKGRASADGQHWRPLIIIMGARWTTIGRL